MDGRLRLRFLLALLSALLAWFVWAEQRRASDELAAALQAQTRSSRENSATALERERREHFFRVAERLAERAPPPKNAAAVRGFFLQVAEDHGVELSASRLQPLVRPPDGTLGAEARITLLGDPAALSRFLASVEGRGWPLRTERATLAIRGGLGTLTATALVWWPDPAASFTAVDAGRVADDPRMEQLFAWLESAPSGPEHTVSRSTDEPDGVEAVPAMDAGPDESIEKPPETVAPALAARSETPQLHGFVDVGSGTPVRAALFYRGETTLVGVGDRVGEYTVVTLEPSEAVVLSRGEGPPLRLVLR